MWRIFSFDIHQRPSVIRLPFHFEGEHQIIFDEDEVIEQVLEKPSVNTSMFLEWMKCNGCNQQARQLTYVDFPTKFIWDKDDRVWKLRKRKIGAIGRIHHVSPAAGDHFYLGILLNKVKGPTSYEEIRWVNGILFDNFKDACYHLGLLDDDNEYIETIKEAFFGEGGHFVRNFFAQLLLTNTMSRPEDVFDKTFEFLSVDVVHPNRPDLTLQEIERLLQRNSSSLRNFISMPFPSYNTRNISENHLIIDELPYDKSTLEVEHTDFITKLTTEQKDAYDQIIKAVDEGTGDVFFLYGYGGTGKTFLWKTLTAALRSKGEIVLNVATSGIAALLLSEGRTAHSRFRIPLQPTDESFCTIKSDSNLAELIRRAKLIIWDEAPMVNKMCVEALDRSFRDICRQINPHSMDTLFGGKIVVFGGDFRQILPIIQKGTRQDRVAASLNSSYLWDYVTVLKLTVNMRLGGLGASSIDADTRKFAEWMLEIGNGNVGESEDRVFDIEIPQDLLITDSVDPISSMISTIYPEYLLNLANPHYYQQRAILAPTHEVVDIINDRMMHCMEGEERSYLSSDSICASQRDTDFNSELYNTDFLNSIEVGGLPKHNLRLKVSVPVMLLRNVDQAGGLCNGTRLQVIELGERMIKAKILTGSNVGKITAISQFGTPRESSHTYFATSNIHNFIGACLTLEPRLDSLSLK
ncbi:ATP-dependent DNA helicase PIF1-like [Rutidosis leptorrhynchoides]|uniref:ATP-dependent DNA helicase PIF1-like n=1 Tax=Rutidosis leptorrhynchoides TaxID=125765 RepID=UPI003A990D54